MNREQSCGKHVADTRTRLIDGGVEASGDPAGIWHALCFEGQHTELLVQGSTIGTVRPYVMGFVFQPSWAFSYSVRRPRACSN